MAKQDFPAETPSLMKRSELVDHRDIDQPDRTKNVPHGRIDLVDVGDSTIGRTRFEPGWRWSQDVKPLAKTEHCQLLHRIFIVTGRMRIQMEDGSEVELGAGDAAYVPPGHDAWVVGDEPVVNISFSHAPEPTSLEDPSKD